MVATFGPGDLLGEHTVLAETARRSTVVAVEDLTTVVIHRAALLRGIAEARPDTVLRLVKTLSQQLCDHYATVDSYNRQGAYGRIALALRELALTHARGDARDPIQIRATQMEIGQLANVSRATVNGFLGELAANGVISKRRGTVVIHDLAALDRYVY